MNTKLTYQLERETGKEKKPSASGKDFLMYVKGEGWKLIGAMIAILATSTTNMLSPFLIGKAIDTYIKLGDLTGLTRIISILMGAYLITLVAGYIQGILIGRISQRTLYRLREALFAKLQELPIAFFNQNKSGDLMSRINNDTDKVNQFLSQSISQFIGILFSMIGIMSFSLYMNVKLTLVMMSMTIFLLLITKVLSVWMQKENTKSLNAVGNFSASLQENLTNFKVVAVYNKREYLKEHLDSVNNETFKSGLTSGTGNKIFESIYDFGGSIALVAVLAYGFYLISIGQITVGIMIAFVAYTQKFYDPLRYLASIFGALQLATAAWTRIKDVLSLKNNLKLMPIEETSKNSDFRMEFKNVSFAYEGGQSVIEHVNLKFEIGKTYALVGPTGGGKSTLVSLMAHLYDPTVGDIYLNGKNICSYSHDDRAKEISVILQDPILFSGTVAENISYGNIDLLGTTTDGLQKKLIEKGFAEVIGRFENGLDTPVHQNGTGLSTGQKQLISFMRAFLRSPKLLILDEATANIDTVTEAMLNKALVALPKETTKIIVAHRLNTIKDADEIMFVNGHHVTPAGSYEHAISLISNAKRSS